MVTTKNIFIISLGRSVHPSPGLKKDSGFAGNSIQSQALFAKPAKSIVTGKHGTYSIEYDASTWVLQREVSNTDAEYEFQDDNGDAYAIIPKRPTTPTPQATYCIKDFITAVGNIYADKDRPDWVFDSPPKQQELIRYQVWLAMKMFKPIVFARQIWYFIERKV